MASKEVDLLSDDDFPNISDHLNEDPSNDVTQCCHTFYLILIDSIMSYLELILNAKFKCRQILN